MENEIIQNNRIEDEVLKKIECGELKMRSRAFFIIKVVILIGLTFFTFITSVLLVSYLLFSLKVGGNLFLLGFGTKGVYKFFLLLPWFILVMNAFLLIFLDYLLRRFKFGYNSPLVYLFLATLVFVTTFSFLVNYTSLHKSLMAQAERKAVPIFGGFYGELRKSHKKDGVLRGQVVSVGNDYVVIKHFDYENGGVVEEQKIYIPKSFNLRGFINIGDEIFIASDIASGTDLVAFGLKKISDK